MDTVVLKDRSCALNLVWLNITSGNVTVRHFKKLDELGDYRPRGFIQRFREGGFRESFAAIYSDKVRVLLQIGTRIWELGTGRTQLRCTPCLGSIINHFEVIDEGLCVFSHWYVSPRINPLSWDNWDYESEDFWYWLAICDEERRWPLLIKAWNTRLS